MTSFQIKLLAALLMVIDHVGVVFFPDQLLFRYVGRLSFPLFAWLLGQGEKHTKNFNSYLIRLAVGAIVSQPFYQLLFNFNDLNILFTLLMGLLAIRLGKLVSNKYLVWFSFAGIAQTINANYGFYGVIVTILLSQFDFHNSKWWLKWVSINLLVFVNNDFEPYQALAIFAPFIINLWNSKQGRKLRLFYFFYPAHLFFIKILGIISV